MESGSLVSVSFELIFQIVNTLIILVIPILIIYGIYRIIIKISNKSKYEIEINKLEQRINDLEDKIDNKN